MWDKIKERKQYINTYNVILSSTLALLLTLATRVHFEGGVWGTPEQNYMGDFGFSAVLLYVLSLVFFIFVVYHAEKLARQMIGFAARQQTMVPNIRKVVLTWAAIIFLAWTPYYLSYYPGGVYSDTFASISYAYDGIYTNRHPLLYNLLIKSAIDIGEAFG